MKHQYAVGHAKRRIPLKVWYTLIVLVVILLGGILVSRHVYNSSLRAVSTSQQTKIVTIASGSTVKQITSQLQNQHLIRSAWAMELYIHSKELSDKLQAGTYAFSPSETTPTIVKTLTTGKVTTKLVAIIPGRRIDQIRADLINDGFSPSAVDAALQPAQYSDIAVLDYKPATVDSLEGLLWPDSYQKDATTSPSVIIRESLTAMSAHLTPDVQAAFAREGLTTYQGLTLTSIVLQEVSKPSDQTQAAQVFLSRLKAGMMLGSDATTRYGSIVAGQSPNLTYDSPFNTLLHTGLPPSPISTINSDALYAATHPATTNWLYFVTGDDGTTYFSTNAQDHQTLTQKYCHKLCSAETN